MSAAPTWRAGWLAAALGAGLSVAEASRMHFAELVQLLHAVLEGQGARVRFAFPVAGEIEERRQRFQQLMKGVD